MNQMLTCPEDMEGCGEEFEIGIGDPGHAKCPHCGKIWETEVEWGDDSCWENIVGIVDN